MGSLAVLAQRLGHTVFGIDQHTYPPMSTQLAAEGVLLREGYVDHGIDGFNPDVVIIGNAMSRGNPAVEYVLDSRLPYCSGPEWLAREVLQGKSVLAVAGTHGKTTTSSMLAWILDCAGKTPGFLIGGVPENFGVSARLGDGDYFVIEADEYDSAFFDKRSKFVHYRPDIAILNNLEFDHADIFDNLEAIQRQFHHLIRTIPSKGCVLLPDEPALKAVLDQGVWSRVEWLSGEQSQWQLRLISEDASQFEISAKGERRAQSGLVEWSLCGEHNARNALAAVAAAAQVGVDVGVATRALSEFVSVKRRLQLLVESQGISLYDDFAHHPTAIAMTLDAVSRKHPGQRILAVVEPRSNTMRMGVHDDKLASAVRLAHQVWWFDASERAAEHASSIFRDVENVKLATSIADIVGEVADLMQTDDVIVVMSNGGFGGIHQLLVNAVTHANFEAAGFSR